LCIVWSHVISLPPLDRSSTTIQPPSFPPHHFIHSSTHPLVLYSFSSAASVSKSCQHRYSRVPLILAAQLPSDNPTFLSRHHGLNPISPSLPSPTSQADVRPPRTCLQGACSYSGACISVRHGCERQRSTGHHETSAHTGRGLVTLEKRLKIATSRHIRDSHARLSQSRLALCDPNTRLPHTRQRHYAQTRPLRFQCPA
jgi:hypothetical protein